jgi:hypothetical protein
MSVFCEPVRVDGAAFPVGVSVLAILSTHQKIASKPVPTKGGGEIKA